MDDNGRAALRSQPGEPVDAERWQTVAPGGAYLRLDTTQPLERCLALALEYLGVAAAGKAESS